MSEKIELLTEFLNISIQVSNCMKTKCKIIDEKIKKNPLYKEYVSKLLSSKTNEELLETIDNIMSVAEYHEYNKCQIKNCKINIKNLVIILLKLYDYYKTKENKSFPVFVENALTILKTAKANKKQFFNKHDREINILLSYMSKI
jgi:hypothetical protein